MSIKRNWTTFCCLWCAQLSTILFSIVTLDPGSTILLDIFDNYMKSGGSRTLFVAAVRPNSNKPANKSVYKLLTSCVLRTACTKYTRKNLTTCNKSADKPSTRCVRTACSKVVNKLFQTCWQLVTSLTKISDLLQGCSNNSDTILL